MDKDLCKRHEIIKLLEETTGKTLSDIHRTSVFLGQSPEARELKTKINVGPNQTHKLLHKKRNHFYKTKGQPKMGESICKQCNQQGLDFQNIQTAHTAHHHQQKTTQFKNKSPNHTDLRRRNTVANRHMKTCSTSLIIRKMQMETTMRYHFTLIRMVII